MRRDDGSAALEFVTVALVLFVPLVYVLLHVFALQRAAFAVSAAAREAGRAYATAPDAATAEERARTAADLALADQLPGAPRAALVTAGDLTPGGTVRVTVTYDVELLAGLGRIPVSATHVAPVDRYR